MRKTEKSQMKTEMFFAMCLIWCMLIGNADIGTECQMYAQNRVSENLCENLGAILNVCQTNNILRS